ncbi:AAA domain-containing protein, partial [Helicobacter japonicus]
MTQKYFILLKGKDKTKEIKSCSFENENLKVIFKNNPQIYTYKKDNFTLIRKATSYNLFNYLKELCILANIETPEGNLNVLLKEYEKMQKIPKESALSIYLNPSSFVQVSKDKPLLIFPFGSNASQYQAVQNAMCHQISIIEGPPGTGKTQTILNIIANLICQNKSIAMLSNNNSATQNIFEKLSSNGFGFFCATLGNKENKENFITNQSGIYPSFDTPTINTQKLKQDINILNQKALESFRLTNDIAKNEAFLNALRLEYKYFKAQENNLPLEIKNLNSLNVDKVLRAKVQIQQEQKLSFWLKLKLIFLSRIGNFKFYKSPKEQILYTLDETYYILKDLEISKKIEASKAALKALEQTNPLQNLIDKSLLLLKSYLKTKYKNQQQRVQFELSDLNQNAATFLQEYPV